MYVTRLHVGERLNFRRARSVARSRPNTPVPVSRVGSGRKSAASLAEEVRDARRLMNMAKNVRRVHNVARTARGKSGNAGGGDRCNHVDEKGPKCKKGAENSSSGTGLVGRCVKHGGGDR